MMELRVFGPDGRIQRFAPPLQAYPAQRRIGDDFAGTGDFVIESIDGPQSGPRRRRQQKAGDVTVRVMAADCGGA